MTAKPDLVIIAEAAHNAMRSFSGNTGTAWDDLPVAAQANTVDQVLGILGSPDITAAEVHDNWMRTKLEAGWVYADTLDPKANPPTSPSLKPYAELEPMEQARSSIFLSVVRGFQQAAFNAPVDLSRAEALRKDAEAEKNRMPNLGDTVILESPARPANGKTSFAATVTDINGQTVSLYVIPPGAQPFTLQDVPAERDLDRTQDQKTAAWRFQK